MHHEMIISHQLCSIIFFFFIHSPVNTNKVQDTTKIGSREWRFEGNSKPYKPSELSINIAFNWSSSIPILDEEDNRDVIPLGHGDLSSVSSQNTATATEDAIIDAIRSLKFKRHFPIFGIPKARRAVADHLSRNLLNSLKGDDVYLTSGCIQGIQTILPLSTNEELSNTMALPCFTVCFNN